MRAVFYSLQYVSLVIKYDSRGYAKRGRVLVITSEAVYILNQKDFKLKLKIPFTGLTGIFSIHYVIWNIQVML